MDDLFKMLIAVIENCETLENDDYFMLIKFVNELQEIMKYDR